LQIEMAIIAREVGNFRSGKANATVFLNYRGRRYYCRCDS
jgi:hypothetical protein